MLSEPSLSLGTDFRVQGLPFGAHQDPTQAQKGEFIPLVTILQILLPPSLTFPHRVLPRIPKHSAQELPRRTIPNKTLQSRLWTRSGGHNVLIAACTGLRHFTWTECTELRFPQHPSPLSPDFSPPDFPVWSRAAPNPTWVCPPPCSNLWRAEFDFAQSLRQIFNDSMQMSTLPSDPCSAGGSWEQGQAGRGWRTGISPPNHHISLSSSSIPIEDSGLEHKAVTVKHIYGVLVTGVPKNQVPKPPKTKRTRGQGTKFCLILMKHLHSGQTNCSNIGICKAPRSRGWHLPLHLSQSCIH